MPVTITSIDNRTPYLVTVYDYQREEPIRVEQNATVRPENLRLPECKTPGQFAQGHRLVLRTPGIHSNVIAPNPTPDSEYSIWQGKVTNEKNEFIVFTFNVPGATQFTKNDVKQTEARKLTNPQHDPYEVDGNSKAQLRIEIAPQGRYVYFKKE